MCGRLSSRTRGGSSAHRARVKAADLSMKRVEELLVCAAVAFRVGELVAAPGLDNTPGYEKYLV